MQSATIDFILEGDTEEFCSVTTVLIPVVGSTVTLEPGHYYDKGIPIGTAFLATKLEYCYFQYNHRLLVTLKQQPDTL